MVQVRMGETGAMQQSVEREVAVSVPEEGLVRSTRTAAPAAGRVEVGLMASSILNGLQLVYHILSSTANNAFISCIHF